MGDELNYSLFDETELGSVAAPASAGLVIRAEKSERLSPRQRAFNRLTKRIAALECRLSSEHDKCERLLAAHNERVRPLEVALAGRCIDLAKTLAASFKRLHFTKKQTQALRTVIVELCAAAFDLTPPDAETEAFYDEWAGTPYRDDLAAQALEFKLDIAKEVHVGFGIDIDVAGDDASPEAMARFINGVEEKLRTSEPPQRGGRRRHNKTAKQAEKEERFKAQQERTTKTLRGIYLALAKILHPDTVADPHERAHREEFMKKATSAYREGDVYALLQLEIQWATHDGGRLSTLSDETLEVYIHALKGQVAELEAALRAQCFDPRYGEIEQLITLAEHRAEARMRDRVSALRTEIDQLVSDHALVSRATRSSVVMDRVYDYLAQSRADHEMEELAAALWDDFATRR